MDYLLEKLFWRLPLKVCLFSKLEWKYKSESFNTLRLTGYAQSRIKHKGFGKGRKAEAFYGKNY